MRGSRLGLLGLLFAAGALGGQRIFPIESALPFRPPAAPLKLRHSASRSASPRKIADGDVRRMVAAEDKRARRRARNLAAVARGALHKVQPEAQS
jgi:hypothetical protein